ncbi:unnamed protein product [Urochloa decumbens]|uniref:Flavin-containing monooxygenase n=1 Tax=Urochloa decumbens TaxID=240449 RepID=A0ABC9D9Q9_9POAL
MASPKKNKKKRVCVVGAGVAGLGAARELRREGHDVTVMEQGGGVGGQWLYDPATDGGDPLGTAGAHSSIYASLRLNTPREAIGFSDFPFFPNKDGGGDARRYPCHGEFLRYIRDFCGTFGLMDAVRLNTKVLRVAMVPPCDGDVRWVVRYGGEEMGTTSEEEVFDSVVVAVARRADQVVVVVGCHESGKDIALELCEVAREVHVSVRSMEDVAPGVYKALSRRHNLHLQLQIDCLCEDGRVVFADATGIVADAVVYCTGYNYSFPFLDTAGIITVDDNRVGPLYEHTFPPALAPTLSFVSVAKLVVVPRFFEAQARWVAQVLSGRRSLPPVEDYHRAREVAGVPKRHTHNIAFDWDYCDGFGEKHCGFPRLEDWKKELIRSSMRSRLDDPESCRDNYHDSDLVLEGLRSKGWLTGRAPAMQDKDDSDGQERAPNPQTHL